MRCTDRLGCMLLDDATERALDDRSLRQELEDAETAKEKLAAITLWLNSTRLMRANARVGMAQGNLLAGGIAYTALISIFAALVIGWTIFMSVLGGNQELRDSVLESINDFAPGLVGYGSGDLVSPDSLVMDTAINLVSVITAGALLWSALALMQALRLSVRQVFGIASVPESFVVMKIRDLLGFIALALAVVMTAALSIAVVAVGDAVFEFIGIDGAGARFGLHVASIAAAFIVDALVFMMLIRVVSGARPRRNDLLLGAAIGALASGVIRFAGSAVISAPDDPVFASIATVGTLLVGVNLLARVVLYVAAFIANPPAPLKPKDAAEVHFHDTPNFVTLSEPETLEWEYQPTTGSVIPDPSLNPDAESEPPTPRWGGLIGWYQRRRIDRIARKLERARDSYYR